MELVKLFYLPHHEFLQHENSLLEQSFDSKFISTLYRELIKLFYKSPEQHLIFKDNLIHFCKNNKKNIYVNILFQIILGEKEKEYVLTLIEENFHNLPSNILDIIFCSWIGKEKERIISIIKKSETTPLNYNSLLRYLVSNRCNLSYSESRAILAGNQSGAQCIDFLKKSITTGPKRKLNIAVCISGQFRGTNTALAWTKKFFDGHNVTYFVSTWRKSGTINNSSINLNRIFPKQLSDIISILQNVNDADSHVILNELIESIKPQPIVESDAVLRMLGCNIQNIVIEDETDFHITNPEKMYYKINSCFKLMESSNTEFDIYIRLRPDLYIDTKNKKIDDVINTNFNGLYTLYGYTNAYYGYGVDDKFSMGKYLPMKIYSSVWDLFDLKLLKPNGHLYGHLDLANILELHSVDVIGLDDLTSYFCDNEPITYSTKEKLQDFINGLENTHTKKQILNNLLNEVFSFYEKNNIRPR